jgi:hypothetical protein
MGNRRAGRKTAIVTGGGGRIGRATSPELSFGSVTDTTLEQWAEPIECKISKAYSCARVRSPPFVAQRPHGPC